MESEKKKKKGQILKRVHRRKSESGGAGVRALRHLGRMERDKEEMNRLWEGEAPSKLPVAVRASV